MQIDFDDEASILEFEPCEGLNADMFGIKSYADVPFEPFRSNAENHLSNISPGFSCFRTTETFYLDLRTEIDSIIYLNSNVENSGSYVEIRAFDTEEGDLYTVARVEPSQEWIVFSELFNDVFTTSIDNAKVNH